MKTYYVRETTPGALKSLEEALSAARETEYLLSENEPIRIVVDGTVHLKRTIQIRETDMPSAEHPVVVEGINNGTIAGGKRLAGFHRWKNNIWRVELPDIEYTRHLYIDGKPAKRPSTPYHKSHCWDKLTGDDYCFSNLPGEKRAENDWSGIVTTHTEIADWRNINDIEMVFEIGWTHHIVPIESVKMLPDGTLYIKPVEPAFRSSRTLGGVQISGYPNYLENVFELLGKPLEWYFDRREHMLYVGFAEGDAPENHTIVLPVTEQLMEISGSPDRKLVHLRFKNITFSYTTWLRPARYGLPEIQANQLDYTEVPKGLEREKPYEADYQKVISAVRIMAARDVNFENCVFTALGTGALQFEFGTEDCGVVGNRFFEIGGSAVTMGDFWKERAHHPKDRREIVRAIEVKNNLIHDTGKDFRGSVAIIAGYVQDVTVAHNLIYNVPYSAISFGWGWGRSDVAVGPYRPTPWKEPTVGMRNRIMYNHIHHCMTLLTDGGAIYTIGCMNGTVITGNYIHESAGFHGDGYPGVDIGGYNVQEVHDPAADPYMKMHGFPGGIYLDEGSIGIDVCENVIHDVAVPFFYHNQVDLGYTKVWFRNNTVNKRPGDKAFPETAVGCAGLEPEYRKLKG